MVLITVLQPQEPVHEMPGIQTTVRLYPAMAFSNVFMTPVQTPQSLALAFLDFIQLPRLDTRRCSRIMERRHR